MQNNRQNELIRAIIEKKLREEAQTQQLQNSSNPLDRINGISNRVGNFGEGLSNTGNFLGNKFSSKSTNYYRSKNEGKNVIKVEYGEKPDSHNYTHVTYGAKPEQRSTTHITYGEKPQSNNSNGGKKDNTPRIKVKSPDGKVGSIPASQLADAIKKGFKKL